MSLNGTWHLYMLKIETCYTECASTWPKGYSASKDMSRARCPVRILIQYTAPKPFFGLGQKEGFYARLLCWGDYHFLFWWLRFSMPRCNSYVVDVTFTLHVSSTTCAGTKTPRASSCRFILIKRWGMIVSWASSKAQLL